MLSVDELLDEMDSVLENAKTVPLSGKKAMVDVERLSEIIEDIRCHMPKEIRQARAIAADRNDIIADAHKEAEGITRKAEERARLIVSQEEITRRATVEANERKARAQTEAREVRKGATEYAEGILRTTEDFLTQRLTEIRQARVNLRNTMRSSDYSLGTAGVSDKTERRKSVVPQDEEDED